MKEINPSPVYFLELELENVRCFGPKQTIDFRNAEGGWSKWTVILGDNGVGKTTLLQCLWLMSPVARGLSSPNYRAGGNLRELLSRDGHTYELAAAVRIEHAATTTEARAKDVGSDNLREIHDYIYDGGIDPMMVCVAYGASRKPSPGTVAAQADWDAATLFEEDKFLLTAEEQYLRSDYAAKSSEGEVNRAVAQFRDIRKILLDLLGVADLRVSGLDQRVAKPSVEAQIPSGWVPLRNFSLGYRTSIAWIVDFALRLYERYPDSDNPLAEPAVCLVDEIDLHLHPRWQRQLIEFLDQTFPRTQFIVTAHSPLIVQAAEDADAKVVVLRYDERRESVIIDDDVEEVRGWRVDQILTSELFGLEGPHSPEVNQLYARRAELVMAGPLDDESRRELADIDEKLDALPAGDTPEQRRAWDVLQRLARKVGPSVEK
jgi:energy-coupling factor transporter ATP-binding protein EcfA2